MFDTPPGTTTPSTTMPAPTLPTAHPKLTITHRIPLHAPTPATTPLSLTASAATMWPATPLTLFYPPVTLHPARLTEALRLVIAAYPLLASRLTTTPPPGAWPAHTKRHMRVWAHSGPGTHGALLLLTTYAGPLADVLPARINSRALNVAPGTNHWLCDATLTALLPAARARPGPVLALQVTTFHDGVVLALRGHHALLDEAGAAHVLRAWLDTYAALVDGRPLPALTGNFDPAPIAAAGGDVDAPEPDPVVIALADSLPGLKLDLGRDVAHAFPLVAFSGADALPEASNTDGGREGARSKDETEWAEVWGEEGPAPPWSTWDWTAGVRKCVLRFSHAELARLKARARATGKPGDLAISRLDAALALAWGAIVRARRLPPATQVSMGMCIGLRPRLPLAADHLGPDLVTTAAVLPASATSNLSTAASALRATINTYTPQAVAAELRRMAYASDPARRWNMFFGARHCQSTAWMRAGLYEIQMGGVRPLWVQAAFAGLDGFLVAIESAEGIDVQLALEAGVMAEVLADPGVLGV